MLDTDPCQPDSDTQRVEVVQGCRGRSGRAVMHHPDRHSLQEDPSALADPAKDIVSRAALNELRETPVRPTLDDSPAEEQPKTDRPHQSQTLRREDDGQSDKMMEKGDGKSDKSDGKSETVMDKQ